MTIVNSNRKKPIYGIGINDADYPVAKRINGKHKIICKFYQTWRSMLFRCYSEKSLKASPTYMNCTVCDEWLIFSRFRIWMKKQDWDGKQLDKDIIFPGNKVYSPEACAFVDQATNKLLCKSDGSRGKHPIGVCYSTQKKKFLANLSRRKHKRFLGLFDTAEEASKVYLREKRLSILRIACCEPDVRVKQGLYRHSLTYL